MVALGDVAVALLVFGSGFCVGGVAFAVIFGSAAGLLVVPPGVVDPGLPALLDSGFAGAGTGTGAGTSVGASFLSAVAAPSPDGEGASPGVVGLGDTGGGFVADAERGGGGGFIQSRT
jgi:hypothetical protein